jgi:hypothetical protein
MKYACVSEEDVQNAKDLLGLDTESLANLLKAGYNSIIGGADEWKLLADHVISLIALGIKNSRSEDCPRCDYPLVGTFQFLD